jgi:hypothetical protein
MPRSFQPKHDAKPKKAHGIAAICKRVNIVSESQPIWSSGHGSLSSYQAGSYDRLLLTRRRSCRRHKRASNREPLPSHLHRINFRLYSKYALVDWAPSVTKLRGSVQDLSSSIKRWRSCSRALPSVPQVLSARKVPVAGISSGAIWVSLADAGITTSQYPGKL